MDRDKIEEWREKHKDEHDQRRRQHRRCAIDHRRDVADEAERSLTKNEIVDLALRIKSKHHKDRLAIRVLQNALLQSEDNILTFMKVDGALRGLVKLLTDTEADDQLLAAKCCCNISLGSPKTCLILVKASSAYLMSYLNSPNSHLVELCCWTLGNIIAGSEASISLLKSQNFVQRLSLLLDKTHDGSVVDAASYALGQYLYHHKNMLCAEEVEILQEGINNIEAISRDTLWLLQLCASVNLEIIHNRTIEILLKEMFNLFEHEKWESELVNLNCIIRIFANCFSSPERMYNFQLFNENFAKCIFLLLSSKYSDLSDEVMWLLGNLFNNTGDSSEKLIFYQKISPLLTSKISS